MTTLEGRLASLITALGTDYKAIMAAIASAGGGAVSRPKMISGNYYGHSYLTSVAAGTGAPPASGTLILVPLIVPRTTSFDRLSLDCTSSIGGAAVRLGIYNSDSDGMPSTLAKEFGVVDAAATGERAAVNSVTLNAGFYWMAYLSESTAGGFRTISSSGTIPFLGHDRESSSSLVVYNGLQATGVTTGSLPSTCPSTTPVGVQSLTIKARVA